MNKKQLVKVLLIEFEKMSISTILLDVNGTFYVTNMRYNEGEPAYTIDFRDSDGQTYVLSRENIKRFKCLNEKEYWKQRNAFLEGIRGVYSDECQTVLLNELQCELKEVRKEVQDEG